jgi:hypothetical protein
MISYVPLMSTTSKGNNEFPQIKVHIQREDIIIYICIEKIYVYRYYLYKRLCKLKFAIRI